MKELNRRIDEAIVTLRQTPRDEAAWRCLFSTTWPYVIALARNFVTSPTSSSDAEDLAQEVFLRLGKAWHSGTLNVQDADALRALLAVITRSVALDRKRMTNRLRRNLAKEVPLSGLDDIRDTSESSKREMEWHDLLETVCNKLQEKERKILEMRLEGYTIDEIARFLTLSSRTVDRKLIDIKDVINMVWD